MERDLHKPRITTKIPGIHGSSLIGNGRPRAYSRLMRRLSRGATREGGQVSRRGGTPSAGWFYAAVGKKGIVKYGASAEKRSRSPGAELPLAFRKTVRRAIITRRGEGANISSTRPRAPLTRLRRRVPRYSR